jgi:hypothetical protein
MTSAAKAAIKGLNYRSGKPLRHPKAGRIGWAQAPRQLNQDRMARDEAPRQLNQDRMARGEALRHLNQG